MSAPVPTGTATMTDAPDADRALRSALQLFTPTELARGLGVSDRTVRRWTRRQPAIPDHWSATIGRLMRDWTANAPAGTGTFRFIDLFAGIGGMIRRSTSLPRISSARPSAIVLPSASPAGLAWVVMNCSSRSLRSS